MMFSIIENKAKVTLYKALSAGKRFHLFQKQLNPSDNRSYSDLSSKELDFLMCKFSMNAKDVDKIP